MFTPNPFVTHFCIEWQVKIETPQRKIIFKYLSTTQGPFISFESFQQRPQTNKRENNER
jgi:hypothetical protein